MSEEKFQLALSGGLIDGFDREESLEHLCHLLRLSPEQANTLLKGKKSLIRKPLAFAKADHLRQKLVERGIECHLERFAVESKAANSTPSATPSATTVQAEQESLAESAVGADAVVSSDLTLDFEIDENDLQPQVTERVAEDQEVEQDWPDELELVPVDEPTDVIEELENDPQIKGEEIILASAPPPEEVVKINIPKPGDEEQEGPSDDQPESVNAETPSETGKPDADSMLNTGTFFEQPTVIRLEQAKSTPLDYKRYLVWAGGALVIVGAVWLALPMLTGEPEVVVSPEPQSSPVVQVEAPPADPELAATNQRLDGLFRSVKVWMIQFGSGFDPNQVTLERLQQDLGMADDEMVDGWGQPFQYSVDGSEYRVTSAGPDGQFGNEDDLTKQGSALRK
ncbi:MAG: type II secretion system protein GspG [Chromatiales bacterium]|nr:type II secretion system protein GspG [Chromatiales bacterium]